MLRAFGSTDRGPVRQTNEDRFGVDERLGLCVLADGMGGHSAGEVAAWMAVDGVADYLRAAALEGPVPAPGDQGAWPFGFQPSLTSSGNLLRTAVLMVNVQILDAAITTNRYAGMGTTIVVALVRDGRLSVAHVGDSRLYLFGPSLRQLTRDDSWMEETLAANSRADRLLLQHHPMRNALTSAVGVGPCADVHVVEEALHGGERIVLTTDGVHGVLDELRLEELLAEEVLESAPRTLVAAAIARGSRDNCTAIVAEYGPQSHRFGRT